MWRNMDDRLERRRELLIPIPGGVLEKGNIGGWGVGEGNAVPRIILPEMDNVGKSAYRKVLFLMTADHHKPSNHLESKGNVTGRRE